MITIGLLLSLPGWAYTQGEFGPVAGISNYQGDLASFSTANGIKVLVHPVLGMHGGLELSNHFQWRADLLYTRLSGDDALNEKENTRSRNLSFFSPVVQLAAGMDWNWLSFSHTGKSGFTPYLYAGASLFWFSPHTRYEGKKVALRPLGTEGQFLDDFPDQKPYSPVQPTVQLGGGLKLRLQGGIVLAMEAVMSLAFTDYIDDVSTIYISYPELLQKAGPLTAALANRQGEYFGTEPVVVATGTSRANAKTKDYFGVITVRAGFPFEIRSRTTKVRRSNPSRRMNCPKF